MTGNRLADTPPYIEDRQHEIDRLVDRILPAATPKTSPVFRPAVGLDDQDVLQKARAARNDNFDRLYNGDIAAYRPLRGEHVAMQPSRFLVRAQPRPNRPALPGIRSHATKDGTPARRHHLRCQQSPWHSTAAPSSTPPVHPSTCTHWQEATDMLSRRPSQTTTMRRATATRTTSRGTRWTWSARIAGEKTRPSAHVFARSDGLALLPPGINYLFGDSGDGKSFVALVATILELRAGHPVIWVTLRDANEDLLVDHLNSSAPPKQK